MPIFTITDDMWDGILSVQKEAYFEVAPEPLDVLRRKWELSPDCCFVYKTDGSISAYLLAHQWGSDTPPKLHQRLPQDVNTRQLFLHDLAVAKHVKGRGVGKLMVERLLQLAKTRGFEKILLVSIQGSTLFWNQFGFNVLHERKVCASYGDGAMIMSLDLGAEYTAAS